MAPTPLTLEEKLWLRVADARPMWPRWFNSDPILRELLAKPDERLLLDAGLTRRDMMSEDAYLNWIWDRDRLRWSL